MVTPVLPTLVLFVRHGTTPTTGKVLPGRAPGLHLSDQGKEQASAVAERIGALATHAAKRRRGRTGPTHLRFGAVYASPLERTRETASPIATALGMRVRSDRRLIDCDPGDWTGDALKDLAKRPEWATVQRYPSGFRFPGGESFSEMRDRIVGSVQSICSRHRGEAVVVVSHADPIKALVADALGSHLDLFQRINISPCSVSAVLYGALGPAVLAVNSTGSLAELVPS